MHTLDDDGESGSAVSSLCTARVETDVYNSFPLCRSSLRRTDCGQLSDFCKACRCKYYNCIDQALAKMIACEVKAMQSIDR